MAARIYAQPATAVICARLTPQQAAKFQEAVKHIGESPSVIAREVLMEWADAILETQKGARDGKIS